MVTEARINRSRWVYNLGDDTQGIHRTLGSGIQTRIFPGQHVMLSVVRIEPDTTGTVHSHTEEQWGILLEGECVRIQGDEEIDMKPGDFWHTPGGISHGIKTGSAGAIVLDIFGPPKEEYKKPGEGFGSANK